MRSFEPGHQLCSPPGPVARMVWPLVMALPVVLSGCASIVIHDRPVFDRTSLETASSITPPPAEALRSSRLAWHWTRNIPNGRSRTTAMLP